MWFAETFLLKKDFVCSDQLVELMHSRARRRFSRGLKRKPMALIKKLRKAKKEAPPNEKPAIVKSHLRNMIVVPEMVGSIIGVYNGKTFNQVRNFDEFFSCCCRGCFCYGIIMMIRWRDWGKFLSDVVFVFFKFNCQPKFAVDESANLNFQVEITNFILMWNNCDRWPVDLCFVLCCFQVEIKPEMIGHYLGEFSLSYKPVKHGRPGIGATHSSRFIPLK